MLHVVEHVLEPQRAHDRSKRHGRRLEAHPFLLPHEQIWNNEAYHVLPAAGHPGATRLQLPGFQDLELAGALAGDRFAEMFSVDGFEAVLVLLL